MALRRKTTMQFKRQAVDSAAESLTINDLIPVRSNPTVTPDFQTTERDQARESFDKPLAAESFKAVNAEFAMDLQGPADADPTTDPPFTDPLLCSGMRKRDEKRVRIGALSTADAVIPSGTTYTGGTSGATGRILGDLVDGDPYFYAVPDPGSAAIALNEVITFAVSPSVTATTHASIAAKDAKGFHPITDALSKIAIDSVAGGSIADRSRIIQDQGSGVIARGVARLDVSMGAGGGTLYFVHDDATAAFDDSATITLPDFPGVSATVTSSEAQDSEGNAAATFGGNYDGTLIESKGGRFNAQFVMPNGDTVRIEFSGQGAGKAKPGDAPILGSPTDGQVPPPVIGGIYLIGPTYVPKFSEATWDLGNDVSLRECPDDSSGYQSAIIGDRNPVINIDPELVKEAVFPALGNLWDKSAFRVVFQVGADNDNGNTFQFQAKSAQVESLSPGDRGGITTWDKVLSLRGITDDSLILHCF